MIEKIMCNREFTIATFFLITVLGCDGGGGGNQYPANPVAGDRISVTGNVSNRQGQTLPNVIVSTGDQEVITNATGDYEISFLHSGERITLDARAPDHAPNIAVLNYRAGVKKYRRDIVLSRTVTASVTATGASATVKSENFDVDVTLPAGVLPSGSQMIVAGYDAGNGPGDLQSNMPAGSSRLQTQGMIYVGFRDASGNRIQLPEANPPASGNAATITLQNRNLQVPPGAGEMRQWKLSDQAIWTSGTPTLSTATGLQLLAQQEGFWNCDRNYPTACICGKLETDEGSCGGATVQATALGATSLDTSGADGSFCLEGPQGWTMPMVIGGQTIQLTLPNTPGTANFSPEKCGNAGIVLVEDGVCGEIFPDTIAPPDPGTCANTGGSPNNIYANASIYVEGNGQCGALLWITTDATGKIIQVEGLASGNYASDLSGSVTSSGQIQATALWSWIDPSTHENMSDQYVLSGQLTTDCVLTERDFSGIYDVRTFGFSGTFSYTNPNGNTCFGTATVPY